MLRKIQQLFFVGATCSRECVNVSELCCVFILEEELLCLSTEVLLAGSQFSFAVHFVVWLLVWLFVVVVGWLLLCSFVVLLLLLFLVYLRVVFVVVVFGTSIDFCLSV